MSAESSPNTSFTDDSAKPAEPLTPGTIHLLSARQSSANAAATPAAASSKFGLFDATTPLRSTNILAAQNASTAPPFLGASKGDTLTTQIPADLVDAIGALDLDFGAKRGSASGISTAPIEPTDAAKVEAPLPTLIASANTATDTATKAVSGAAAVDPAGEKGADAVTAKDAAVEKKENVDVIKNPEGLPVDPSAHFGDGMMHHHQPFPPFFPMNGFGQPLHAGFGPGDHLEHPQPWSSKPGQPPHFPNAIGGLENLAHTPPIPPPGMIPMGPFDFGPDGVTPPLPPHLHPEGFINLGLKEDGSLKDRGSFTPPGGFRNIEGPFNNQHGLQNNQLWPPLNGAPQSFDSSFGAMGLSPNPNNNPRFFTNGGSGQHHHHHHNNGHHNGRKFTGQRRRGEDASKFANAKLKDFIGQIYSLCKDQHGCRFLQKQLDIDSSNATAIFREIHTYVIELMIDPFGNYLIQKLLENVNDEERITLVQNASPQFVQIALDSHGTRALQKLVECIDSQEEAKIIVNALKNDVVLLSRDLNGNHVIQKCLQRLTSFDSQFIFDSASEHCLEIATHRHGCCVLQRCLDYGSDDQCKKLSLVVSNFTKELSLDPYGNYVVQYVLTKNIDSEAIKRITNGVKEKIVEFALHKFGSNVIEKCLKTTKYGAELIDELISNEDALVNLLNDSYGNYVLQTSLDVAKGKQFEKLSSILRPLLPQVRNTPHGRRISSRLQQTI